MHFQAIFPCFIQCVQAPKLLLLGGQDQRVLPHFIQGAKTSSPDLFSYATNLISFAHADENELVADDNKLWGSRGFWSPDEIKKQLLVRMPNKKER